MISTYQIINDKIHAKYKEILEENISETDKKQKFINYLLNMINKLQNNEKQLLDFLGVLYINYAKILYKQSEDEESKEIQELTDLIAKTDNFVDLFDHFFMTSESTNNFLAASFELCAFSSSASDYWLCAVVENIMITPISQEELNRINEKYSNFSLVEWQDYIYERLLSDEATDEFANNLYTEWLNIKPNNFNLDDLISKVIIIINQTSDFPEFLEDIITSDENVLSINHLDIDLEPFKFLLKPLYDYEVTLWSEKNDLLFEKWFDSIENNNILKGAIISFLYEIYNNFIIPGELYETDQSLAISYLVRSVFEYLFSSGYFADTIIAKENVYCDNLCNIMDIMLMIDTPQFDKVFVEILITVYLSCKVIPTILDNPNYKIPPEFACEFINMIEVESSDIPGILNKLIDIEMYQKKPVGFITILENFFEIIINEYFKVYSNQYQKAMTDKTISETIEKFKNYLSYISKSK